MTFNRLTIATLCSLMTLMTPASYGNDIVDFLQALNGGGRGGHGHGGHGHGRHGHAALRHGGHGHDDHGHGRVISHGSARHRMSRHHALHAHRPLRTRSVSINIGTRSPSPIFRPHVRPFVTPVLPIVPAVPVYPEFPPHQLGEFVTCPVAVMPHVHVEDAHEIHPHAERVVIAVRDPHLAAWGSPGCVEQLVYVEVFVPPFPPEKVKVSECRTKIELDYGKWEVEITSANGVIEVEYDD